MSSYFLGLLRPVWVNFVIDKLLKMYPIQPHEGSFVNVISSNQPDGPIAKVGYKKDLAKRTFWDLTDTLL